MRTFHLHYPSEHLLAGKDSTSNAISCTGVFIRPSAAIPWGIGGSAAPVWRWIERRLSLAMSALTSNGTINLFVFLDVNRPWRKVKFTERHAAEDFVA